MGKRDKTYVFSSIKSSKLLVWISIHRDFIKTSNISILIFWMNQQCNSFVVKKWLKIEPWPFKCYSTIIWCMVENVGIYSAWYFYHLNLLCKKNFYFYFRIFVVFLSQVVEERTHFFLHSLNYLLYEYYKTSTYIFLYRIGKKIWILQCWHLSIFLFVKKSNIWSVYSTR